MSQPHSRVFYILRAILFQAFWHQDEEANTDTRSGFSRTKHARFLAHVVIVLLLLLTEFRRQVEEALSPFRFVSLSDRQVLGIRARQCHQTKYSQGDSGPTWKLR